MTIIAPWNINLQGGLFTSVYSQVGDDFKKHVKTKLGLKQNSWENGFSLSILFLWCPCLFSSVYMPEIICKTFAQAGHPVLFPLKTNWWWFQTLSFPPLPGEMIQFD